MTLKWKGIEIAEVFIFHFILFLHSIQIVVKTRENKRETRLKKDRKVIPFSSKK